MRIALLSDMHGNGVAFDAMLEDLARHPADRAVCLGDAVQGGPQPAQVATRLRALGCPVVMGNADDWLLRGIRNDAEPIEAERLRQMESVRDWSLAELGADDRAFIAGFQPTVEIALPGGRCLLCFHGSPASYDDVIMPLAPEATFLRLLGDTDADVLAGGHSHLQQVRRFGERWFCNPGSIGFVYTFLPDGLGARAHAWAEYAVLTADEAAIAIEFRRVPYERDALIRVYRASGRPQSEPAIRQYLA